MATMQDTQKAIQDVRQELRDLDAQYSAVGRELGDALARVRTGDKDAKAEAGKISMRRSTIESERDRLRLEERSLMRSLLELEAAADAEEAANAIPAFQEVDDHARELERQFVEVIRSAAHIAGELRAIREPWYKAARQASRAGHVVTTDPPRYTTRLLPSRLVDDVEREIAIWQAPSHERFMRERGPDGPVKLAEGLPAFGEHVQQTIRVERDGLGFLKPPAGMPLPQTNVTYIQDSAPSDQRGFRLPSFRKPKQDAPQASGGMETRGGDVA